MQDMIESAKRAANTAIERAAWEADKMRRASARQRDVELAQRERATLLEQLASLALELEGRGQLAPAALVALAQRLRALDGEIRNGQADAQRIRAEAFTPGSISINVQRKGRDEVPCPSCGRPVRRSAAFCSSCGARMH
jgi:hypothetical protein